MGKILYAIVFVVLLPIALIAWARATSSAVTLSTPHWPIIGYSLATIGIGAILESMRELWFKGGGLPMNAYPPKRFVQSGLYALIPHPIYAGFCAACLGLSLASGSSGGLWLVTPIVILGCIALVKGYEGPALRARFGVSESPFPTPEAGKLPSLGVRFWLLLLRGCERIANSWTCWQIGPVRIINYAAYAGLAAATGAAISILLAGSEHAWNIGGVALAALIGAALSEQLLVGSPTLLRPFGYYGAIAGAAAALLFIALTQKVDAFWVLTAALCVSAPWVVIIGRLRCLVQGCCHGAPSKSAIGIRYRHPLSRACRIANLHNIPTYPTPLYSMIANLVIGLVLARLWTISAPLSMIAGLYLVLAGLARFVEESLRGEPQTRTIAGLHTYQWFAVVSVIVGACMTAVSTPHASAMLDASWPALYLAIGIGTAYACAMGVDFPKSNRLYSRLT